MPYTNAKLSELRKGSVVDVVGFDCMGGKRVVAGHADKLFVECDCGRHFLAGQLEDDNDTLVGIFHYQASCVE